MRHPLLSLVAAAPLAWGLIELLKSFEANETNEIPYQPIQEKLYVQELTAADIIDWFDKHEADFDKDSIRFISTVNERTMKMFAFAHIPTGMNNDKNMLLSIVDKQLCHPKVYCLINFSSLGDDVRELMGHEEYIILEE